jgi:hypothetical protein
VLHGMFMESVHNIIAVITVIGSILGHSTQS